MKSFFLFLLLATPLLAQNPSQVPAQANTVYVSAEGHYESAPDTALVQFNIQAQADTARAAYDRASKAAEQVRQVLRSNGIDPAAAQVGFFSLQPVYDYRAPQHKVVAYQVSSAVSVKLTDFQKIPGIVQQMSDLDVTGDQSISYTLENIDAAKQKAVEDAYHHARDSAETIARAGGRSLAEMLYASVDSFEPVPILANRPVGRMAMAAAAPMTAAPTEGFSPQKVTVRAHVDAIFGLK